MPDNALNADESATIQTAFVVDEDGNPVVDETLVDETLVDDVVIDEDVVDEVTDDSVVVKEPSGEEEVADGSVEEQTDGSDNPTMWVSEDDTVYAYPDAEIEGGDEEPVGEGGVIEEDGVVNDDDYIFWSFAPEEEDGVFYDDESIDWTFTSDGESGESGDGALEGDIDFDPQILYMSAGGGAGPNVMNDGPLSSGADFDQPVYDSFREEAAALHFRGSDYCLP